MFTSATSTIPSPIVYNVAGAQVKDKVNEKVRVMYLARESLERGYPLFKVLVNNLGLSYQGRDLSFGHSVKFSFKMHDAKVMTIKEVDAQSTNYFYVDLNRVAGGKYEASTQKPAQQTSFTLEAAKSKFSYFLDNPKIKIVAAIYNHLGVGVEVIIDERTQFHFATPSDEAVSLVPGADIRRVKDGSGSRSMRSGDMQKTFEYYAEANTYYNGSKVGYFLNGVQAELITL